MSFETNWDIAKYRAEYESDEHWSLKEKFIKAHKTRFPEEELICLAQVFFNIEFMGCRYPSETMTLVAELSKDVARDFRESRKNRLKRTFVTASDAIEAKYKQNTKNDVQGPTFNRKQRIEFAKAECPSSANLSTVNGRKRRYGDLSGGMPKRPKIEPNGDPIRVFFNENPNLILFQGNEEEPAVNIIQATLAKNKMTSKFETPYPGTTWLLFNGIRMIFGESKTDVCEKALQELQKYFYTIKRKAKFLSRTTTIEKDDQRLVKGPPAATVPTEHAKIDSSNLGFKLLQSLGWSGGGLGRAKEGIEEPIQANIKIDRSGLGTIHEGKLNRKVVKNLLTEYKMTNDICDLVFSSEFSKDERAIIHSIAKECQLKSSSFGKLEDRQIVISKNSTIQELFITLLNTTDPLCNAKYEIVPPTELYV